MSHEIIKLLITAMSFVGIVVFLSGLFFVLMDVIEVYLKFREHVLNGDLSKRKDWK